MLAFIGMPGPLEMLIVAFVMLLLFSHRLPSVMRSLGRGVVEFKHGLRGAEHGAEVEPERPKRVRRAGKVVAE